MRTESSSSLPMPSNNRAVLVLALGAAAMLLLRGRDGAVTAGDEESNFIEDGAEYVMGMFSQWPTGSEPYQALIEQAAASNGIPTAVLAWLLWKESRYLPNVINGTKRSRVGALGIAQFMPATAVEWLGSTQAALDPSRAIPGAARYLSWLYDQLGGWDRALAAYNWGIGNVQSKGLGAAPAETRDYYATILTRAGVETFA